MTSNKPSTTSRAEASGNYWRFQLAFWGGYRLLNIVFASAWAFFGRKADNHLFIRSERCHFVQYRDIHLLEVDGNYVRLYFRDTEAMLHKPLNCVEERLARRKTATR